MMSGIVEKTNSNVRRAGDTYHQGQFWSQFKNHTERRAACQTAGAASKNWRRRLFCRNLAIAAWKAQEGMCSSGCTEEAHAVKKRRDARRQGKRNISTEKEQRRIELSASHTIRPAQVTGASSASQSTAEDGFVRRVIEKLPVRVTRSGQVY